MLCYPQFAWAESFALRSARIDWYWLSICTEASSYRDYISGRIRGKEATGYFRENRCRGTSIWLIQLFLGPRVHDWTYMGWFYEEKRELDMDDFILRFAEFRNDISNSVLDGWVDSS